MQVSYTVDMTAALKSLDSMAHPKNIAVALYVGAVYLQSKVSPYPPAVAHPKQPFTSDKQRRYVIMALRKGIIEIPYRRGQSPGSQDLGQRWRIDRSTDGMVCTLRNTARYSRYVVGPNRLQSAYMRGLGWRSQETVMSKEHDAVAAKIVAQLRKTVMRKTVKG